jgi:DNA invertase Pin-like site-specific DNA recombinase
MRRRLRCAVYTRKSTEEGLEQDFNSLDAQREACAAYIKSQAGEGWNCLKACYDDGGISGATMDRPALKCLLADIGADKVDVVVVYKVDRLTRALSDFAKMVEIFDAHGVSFVSVTQQFNTTSSMGRLTLNVLLSFAQFEREVTAERIRDKIAASKKKGMWMGGVVPLGYDVVDRKLIRNEAEAETVRTLFQLYLELGTVKKLVEETGRLLLVTKRRTLADGRRTGGRPFTCGHLYQLLTNPIYIGEIRHKDAIYLGQHDAIVDRETFEAVRRLLRGNATERYSTTNAKAPSLLAGLVYDETGDRLCPTHANKQGRRYRYYISKRLMHRTGSPEDGWRLPAKELDCAVVQTVSDFLKDELRLIDALDLTSCAPNQLRAILRRAAVLAGDLNDSPNNDQRRHLHQLLHRVTLHRDSIQIALCRAGLGAAIFGKTPDSAAQTQELIDLTARVLLKRRGVEAKLIVSSAQDEAALPNAELIALLVRAHQWFGQLARGEIQSAREIARRDNYDPSEVSRTIQLAFLAPDIVEAILVGRQPVELTHRCLMRIGEIPLDWHCQRRLLGLQV